MTPIRLVWRRFRTELCPMLEGCGELASLAARVETAGTSTPEIRKDFNHLMNGVFTRVEGWWYALHVPRPLQYYYDDPSFAARYSDLQASIVPARADLSRRVAQWAWTHLRSIVDGKLTILDLGTGDGNLVWELLKRRPREVNSERLRIVAADRSEAMLKVVEARIPSGMCRLIRICPPPIGDLTSTIWNDVNIWKPALGLQFEGFHAVISQQAFHFAPPPRTPLYNAVHKILHPDGLMVVADDYYHPCHFESLLETMTDGRRRFMALTSRNVSLIACIAGYIFRRAFVQNDYTETLPEEYNVLRGAFPWWYAETHRRYQEFSILIGANRPIAFPRQSRWFAPA